MLHSANSKNSSAAEITFKKIEMNTYTHIPDIEGEVLLVSWVWQHSHLHHEAKCQEVPQNVPLVLDLALEKTFSPKPKNTHAQTPSFFTRTFRTTTVAKRNSLQQQKRFEELLSLPLWAVENPTAKIPLQQQQQDSLNFELRLCAATTAERVSNSC